MKGEFTAVYEKRGKWYIGYIEEIPGVNTQGRTLKEVKRNLREALKLILEVNREITRKTLSGEEIIKESIHITITR
ncbi:MAG: type II toxin-antitoxin system HicB family antitoxin [Caldiserica bacterium]|nr:MAG: type II toxin-antitoxin system HicB family antitoxin [Caldisericota bacterium]